MCPPFDPIFSFDHFDQKDEKRAVIMLSKELPSIWPCPDEKERLANLYKRLSSAMPGSGGGGASKDRTDVEMLVAKRHERCVLEASFEGVFCHDMGQRSLRVNFEKWEFSLEWKKLLTALCWYRIPGQN